MKNEKVGYFIAELRRELGLNQAEFAEKIGVTDKAVSKWETNACMPDANNLKIISQITGTSIQELMNGKREEKNINLLPDEQIKQRRRSKSLKFRSILLIIMGIIFIILFVILLHYFLNTHGKYQLYTLYSPSEKYHIDGNIMIANDMNIININAITVKDEEINDVTIYPFSYKVCLGKNILHTESSLTSIPNKKSKTEDLQEYIEDFHFYIKSSDLVHSKNQSLILVFEYFDKNLDIKEYEMIFELARCEL